MSELKLELETSYHTDSGKLVKIIAIREINIVDVKYAITDVKYSVVYVGDNNNFYDCRGHALERLSSDPNKIFGSLEKPEDLIYPYGGTHPKYSNQNVLNKIAELKEIVEVSGLSVEVIIT